MATLDLSAPRSVLAIARSVVATWLAMLFLAVVGFAQAPTVTAQLSTGIVKLGQNATLVIVVENARSATVEPFPEIDGLRIGPLGPMSTSESSVLSPQGRWVTSASISWRVPVVATKKGEFRIPPISVDVGGPKLATRELVLKVVEDLQGEDLGWFEIDAPDQVAEGQPFSIELRFGWDAKLNGQLNYANLVLPWLGSLAGVVELEGPPTPPNFVELSLNTRDRIRAEHLPDKQDKDRTFSLLRVRRRYLATRAGKIEIPTSHLEFGSVDDSGGFFSVRPAREKQTYYKRFPGFTIDVIKIPEKGRPFEYGGAVGKLSANATPDHRDVDVGESIKLSVEWTGDANLEFFEPPDLTRLDAFKDFRVFGTNDKKSYERRTVIYDIAPISPDVKEIPPVPLSVYDPALKAYTTVATPAIPIHVRPLKNATGLAPEGGPTGRSTLDIRDVRPYLALDAAEGERGWVPWSALGAVFVGWIALRGWVRRSGDPDAPRARARRKASKVLARELATATKASEQARALERFLAARTGESANAWLGRDVVEWAGAGARLSAEDAGALQASFARLDERTWGGTDQPVESAELVAIADRVVKGGL